MKRYIYMVCAALLAGQALAATPAENEERIRRVQQILPPVLVKGEAPTTTPLADRMAELHVPGVSVAVIHEGRIEWARGFGVVSIGGPTVTPDTLFQAASISKPVFALAVMRQVEAGKLNLDANVNDYLKSWKLPDNEFTSEQKVTLRRVLSHTAGLTVHGFPGYEAGAKVPTNKQILDGATPANNPAIRVDVIPGSLYRYSGGGYTLAQLLVHDVTGQEIPKLMRDTVLAPLGMSRSTYEQPLPASRAGEVAQPYRGDGTPVTGGPHVYPELAAAGLWTTPSDLARYALGVREALAGKSKVITAATARLMLTKQLGDHALGPVVGGSTARKYYTHNGGNDGYRCVLVMYEDGEGAVIMSNGDNGGGLMYEVLRTLAREYGWPDFGPGERTLADVKPEALDRLIGVYQLNDQNMYLVRREEGRLVGNVLGNQPVALFPSSDNELFARDANVVASFTADASGAVTMVKHSINGFERTGTRVDAVRAKQVLASAERQARRIKEQKPDPRGDAALRQLVASVASGKPDYAMMSPQLADLTRQQLKGLKEIFTNLGEIKTLTFKRVTESGADEYLAEFAKGKLRFDIGLNDEGIVNSAYFEPR
ncbi:MAG TPA: serine hydrolase [Steroidobacteraceae bacterium]|nr:serine hydrolase [Steroidobacteraceae bacterium]